ncbi:hypothetical protein QZH41_012449, partial [Actinostola sp. cb2023]
LEKKVEPFSSFKRQKKLTTKIKFQEKRTHVLAESDRGSYYKQDELEADESLDVVETSASHSKIAKKELTEEKETHKDKEESWQKICGRTVVCGDQLRDKLEESVCCRFCNEDVEILENIASKQGLGSTWIINCTNSECSSHFTNSAFHTTEKDRGFEINKAFVLGMRTVGKGHSAASKVCSFLGVKQINKQYWTEHANKIADEAKVVLEEELTMAALEVKENKLLLGELDCQMETDSVVDAGITIDGSWGSRGWSANDGIVAVISVDTGKVLDVVHMNSLCPECKKMDQRRSEGEITRLEYLKWFTAHDPKCYLNHEGSSASMEAAGAKVLYQRSIAARGLRYIPFIGDGDSKSYTAVCTSQPYGPSVFIPKEECVAHVTKRMGTGLRALLKEYKGKKLADGKGLSGAGRLTLARVDTFQNFYGRAIRYNKHDAKAMSKATMAILKHYSSSLDNLQHDDCPEGSSSWCSFQRDLANGTNLHKPIKDPLSKAVVEVMQPLFDRLGDESFLVGCENCYTQNANEYLHHVIWGMAPKDTYTSAQEVNTAASLGVLQFNRGFHDTYKDLLPRLEIKVQPNMSTMWSNIDSERLYQAAYRSSEVVKK